MNSSNKMQSPQPDRTMTRIPAKYLLMFASLSAILLLVVTALPTHILSPLSHLSGHSKTGGPAAWLIANKIWLGLAVGGIASLILIITYYFRHKLQSILRKETTDIDSPEVSRTIRHLVLLSVAVLAAIHLPTLTDGTFIDDDFELIRYNRSYPLSDLLVRTHGDHVMPLYRLEVLVLDFLSGTNPFGWNLALLASYSSALLVMGLFMMEIGVCPIGIVFGLTTFGLSHTTSVAMVGYYCVNILMQAATLALAACLCYLRGDRNPLYTALGHALMIIACLIDVANIWVLGAVPLLYLAVSITGLSSKDLVNWFLERKSMMISWLLIGLSIAVFYAAAFRFGPGDRFLSMQKVYGQPLSIGGVVWQTIYYFSSGLFCELYLPIGRNLPSLFHISILVSVLLAAISAVQTASPKNRRILAALFIVILVLAIEVCVARPNSGTGFATQHVTAGQMFATVLAACVFSVMWSRTKIREGLLAFMVLAAIVTEAGCWFPSLIKYRLKMASGLKMLDNLRDLNTRIAPILQPHTNHLHVIPDIQPGSLGSLYPVERWQASLRHYPISAFADFLSIGKSDIRICRNRSMRPSCQVELVASVRQAVSPSFLETLAPFPELGDLFLNGHELRSYRDRTDDVPGLLHSLPSLLHGAMNVHEVSGTSVEFSTDHGAAFVVAEGSWDPEARSILRFDVESISEPGIQEIGISFRGNLPTSRAFWIEVSERGIQHVKVGMLQSVCYALCTNISELQLQFNSPGRYRLGNVSLSER